SQRQDNANAIMSRIHRAILGLALILILGVARLLIVPGISDLNVLSTTTSLGLSDHEFYRAVHLSDFPARTAGSWVMRPDLAMNPSVEHIHCLEEEDEGNCHDLEDDGKLRSIKQRRYKAVTSKKILNSPSVVNASDPWVWESDLEEYRLMPYYRTNQDEYRERIRELLHDRTIYLVGDSLTRQWHQTMKCELIHVIGIPSERANGMVKFIVPEGTTAPDPKGWESFTYAKTASERDYVIFNFGHHFMFYKIGPDWPAEFRKVLEGIKAISFGKIPRSHVFFRTTSIRHFRRGKGDWNTESFQAGAVGPEMEAVWADYGGDASELPEQNLIAFDTFLGWNNITHSGFRILDTSPMTLARADATFDGTHFCVPSLMDFWSRMLYYQMINDE
ncbi:hypothetical protein ACHAWF_002190, partial [Thalassiosira exigua]